MFHGPGMNVPLEPSSVRSKCSRRVRGGRGQGLRQRERDSPHSKTRRSGAVLTIPGILGLSAASWLKLLLKLVENVCGFLKARPVASIDWLLLRITRYRERRVGGDTFRWCWPLGHPRHRCTALRAETSLGGRLRTLTTTGRERWPGANPDRQGSD